MIKPRIDDRQGELDLGPVELVTPLKVFCEFNAAAWRWTQDQYRCGKCGVVWDVDEERPPCQLADSTATEERT